MGQGVNARIAELVATELGLPRNQVRVTATSTDKNANTSPTAASSGTDLNGAAALLATRKIKARLSELATKVAELPESRWARHTAGLGTEPEVEVSELPTPRLTNEGADWPTGIATYHGVGFRDGHVRVPGSRHGQLTFAALINEAYHHRVSLSDYAHYRFPGLSFNKETGQGQAFLYYTNGTAASEVTLDRDTGEVKVARVDLLMDLGRPINEGLDLGQVTGGFVQGMGWVTTEKLVYNSDGLLISHAPSTYKIPSVQDTPRDFRVELLPNDENRPNVRGTKAAGEPPLLLALSVWTAVHDALKDLPPYAAPAYPRLEIPATQEQILRAMQPDAFARWEAPAEAGSARGGAPAEAGSARGGDSK
jgi:xanthine dehydrogenase large subunit